MLRKINKIEISEQFFKTALELDSFNAIITINNYNQLSIYDSINGKQLLDLENEEEIVFIEQITENYGEARGKNIIAGFSSVFSFRANDEATRQFTVGKYGKNYLSLLKLAVPIIIGQLGGIITGLADTIMVGQHSTEELAAASFVNNVLNAFIIFGTGFSFALTPLVGENLARNKKYVVSTWLKNRLR